MSIHSLAIVRGGWLPTRRANGLQTIRMSEAFAELGMDVTLYYVPSRTVEGDLLEYYEVKAPLRLRPLRRALLPMPKAFRVRRWTSWPAFGHAIAWSMMTARIAARSGADLYFVRQPMLAWALGRCHVPTVLELHDIGSGFERIFIRLAARAPTVRALVAVTDGLRSRCRQEFQVADDRITVLPSGVDLNRMVCRRSRADVQATLGLSTDAPVVAYTGSLHAEKGVDTLVSAAPLLDGMQVVISGGTPDEVARVRALAARVGAKSLTMTGYLRPSAVPPVLHAADVLVLPYSAKFPHSAVYTSSLKLFEYMAMRRPIVASNLPSTREILRDGLSAVLVPPDDVGALATGIRRVFEENGLRDRLIAEAYRTVLGHTWKARAGRIVELAAGVPAAP